jgi:uncharacterized membrane protein YphA (DoxX/SURF4 family)
LYPDLSGRTALQRLFSTFPDGRPGSALLLMRIAAAGITFAQGLSYLSHDGNQNFGALFTCLALAVCGFCLLIGFLTPVVSVSVAGACLATVLSWLPQPTVNLFDSDLVCLEMIVLAASIALLGPGAFSLDARLFGRHEVVIPPASRLSKS